MNDNAKEARKAYYRKYYAEHPEARKRKNEYCKKWRQKPENKEKQRKYVENYWIRKAEEMKLLRE